MAFSPTMPSSTAAAAYQKDIHNNPTPPVRKEQSEAKTDADLVPSFENQSALLLQLQCLRDLRACSQEELFQLWSSMLEASNRQDLLQLFSSAFLANATNSATETSLAKSEGTRKCKTRHMLTYMQEYLC